MNDLRADYFGYYRVQCARCGKTKAPVGRSVPVAMYGAYCTSDCSGFHDEPLPSNLWPGESESDFGYRVAR